MDGEQIGTHAAWFESPDMLCWKLTGTVAGEHARGFDAFNRMHGARYLLILFAGRVQLEADARRYWMAGSSDVSFGANLVTAVVGGSLPVRVAANLLVASLATIRPDGSVPHVRFFEAEPAARTWLAGFRRGDGGPLDG